jgi:hydroxymethylpyrimidine/phosphomethylpyrimidine kinase
MIDTRIAAAKLDSRIDTAKVDMVATASSLKAAESSLTTKQSIAAMVDEHLIAKAAVDLKESALAEQRVQALVNASVKTSAQTVNASAFSSKPKHEQCQIVGDAVRSVMKDYHVLPKNNVSSGMQSSMHARGGATASSFDEYSRY